MNQWDYDDMLRTVTWEKIPEDLAIESPAYEWLRETKFYVMYGRDFVISVPFRLKKNAIDLCDDTKKCIESMLNKELNHEVNFKMVFGVKSLFQYH